jgi:hypothetical protein
MHQTGPLRQVFHLKYTKLKRRDPSNVHLFYSTPCSAIIAINPLLP